MIDETCPDCGIQFQARKENKPGVSTEYKRCPNGHLTSMHRLKQARSYSAHSDLPIQPPNPIPVIQETDVMTALAAMVDCYERTLSTIPYRHWAHALVEGSFGNIPDVAKKILKNA